MCHLLHSGRSESIAVCLKTEQMWQSINSTDICQVVARYILQMEGGGWEGEGGGEGEGGEGREREERGGRIDRGRSISPGQRDVTR